VEWRLHSSQAASRKEGTGDLDPTTLIVWLLAGLIIGFLARVLVPGPDPMGHRVVA